MKPHLTSKEEESRTTELGSEERPLTQMEVKVTGEEAVTEKTGRRVLASLFVWVVELP